MLVTNQLIHQVFLVADVASKLATFDHLRWYRSTTGRNGFYEPATAPVAAAALLVGAPVSRALEGLELRLRVGGNVELDVPITLPNPVTASQVADLISTASGLLTARATDGVLVISTVQVGSHASLEILECTAVNFLGFLAGELSVGRDVDSALSSGVGEYRLADYQSSPGFFYRTALVSWATGVSSASSAAFPSRPSEAVPLDRMIGCYVRLCDLAGKPLGGRRIYIHNVFLPNQAEDAEGTTWGVFRQYEEMLTDPNGYASIFLLRGATIDVTISGTGFTRRIVLPTVGTIINLLDATLDVADEFGIQRPALDFAVRTS